MSAPALLFALALAAADATAGAPPPQGEPLPAGAPTEDYPLAAWCYGAMSEYLAVYERVKPDLKAIDKMFGSSQPNEAQPYASDMAAAHVELKVLAGAVTAAEKASPNAIAPQGAEAVKLGRSIWAPAEAKTSRELARAWLSWALPDRCDTTARSLTTKSALLGQALKYNTTPPAEQDAGVPPPGAGSASPSEAPAASAEPDPGAPPPEEPPATPPAAETAPDAPAPPPASEPAAAAPTAGDAAPNPQDAPEVPPAPPTGNPQDQPDPNAPIPDPTPKD